MHRVFGKVGRDGDVLQDEGELSIVAYPSVRLDHQTQVEVRLVFVDCVY